jgi:hypothetical protein
MESARAKHQLTASLPLQVMVYYNVILSVVYFAFAGVGVYIKVNGNYRSIEPYEVRKLNFLFFFCVQMRVKYYVNFHIKERIMMLTKHLF